VCYARYRGTEPAVEYLQIFRSGALEVVDADRISARSGSDPPSIPPVRIEYWLVESVPK
jgi:hypothetical protein